MPITSSKVRFLLAWLYKMVVPPPSPEPHKRVKKIVIQRGLMKKRKKGWSVILNKTLTKFVLLMNNLPKLAERFALGHHVSQSLQCAHTHEKLENCKIEV
jgi:hypothetical protein